MLIALDIETRSGCGIEQGAWAYSLHPTTEVLCVSYGSDADNVRTWEPEHGAMPEDLREHVETGEKLLAFNHSFEHSIFTNVLGPRHAWAVPRRISWRDAQPLCMAINLPANLGGAAQALGVADQKDDDGGKLMRKMAKRKLVNGEWTRPADTPENRARLIEYCEADVRATLAIWAKLPRLSRAERELEIADMAINERGVWLDQAFAAQLQTLSERRQADLSAVARDVTGGALRDAIAAPALKTWLLEKGAPLPLRIRKGKKGIKASVSADKEALKEIRHGPMELTELLYGEEGVDEVRSLLDIRQEATKATSLAKLARVDSMVGTDGRLRNALRFHGAHTGRWTSSGLQVHNLPKFKLGGPELQGLIEDAVEDGDLNWLCSIVPRPMDALSQCLRSVAAAPPGRELIAGDYSAIEARCLAWLAGEEVSLDRFRRKEDIYLATAVDIGAPGDRTLGKVAELGLGYGMGRLLFHAETEKWGLGVEPKRAARTVTMWREARPNIVQFWADLEDAAQSAVRNPDEEFGAGLIVCRMRGPSLRVVLPSGRQLFYWKPKVVRTTKRVKVLDEDGKPGVIEMTTRELRFLKPKGKGMVPDNTYGGKLTENVTQAIARELLGAALVRIHRHPVYDVVLHVHDSVAAEVDTGAGCLAEFAELLERLPAWAKGLPNAAECYRARRFAG